MRKSHSLWNKSKSIILNGTLTLSKSPDYIVPGYPIYVDKAKGAYFWDSEGNRYIDYPLALGPVILGYAYDEVDAAVKEQMAKGFLYSLSSKREIELAELLCEIIPSAEKIKILKTGSEATSAAVRIARAYTRRDIVAVCGYHGWHDWTVVRTERNAGVPSQLRDLIYEFSYNDIDSLQMVFDRNPGKIAAVIMEPVGMYEPVDDFLNKVAVLTRKNGALLIYDEVITGFRLSLGGAQGYFSVTPDLSVFGKAMANCYAIAAVVGKQDIMNEVEDDVFISSTYGGDLLAITAAVKTIEILKENNVNNHIINLGQKLKEGLNAIIENNNISASCEGMPHRTFIVFRDAEGVSSKMIETLFRQECLARGIFLGYGHFICFSHTENDIKATLEAASEVFALIRKALENGNLSTYLKGPVAKDVFKRY